MLSPSHCTSGTPPPAQCSFQGRAGPSLGVGSVFWLSSHLDICGACGMCGCVCPRCGQGCLQESDIQGGAVHLCPTEPSVPWAANPTANTRLPRFSDAKIEEWWHISSLPTHDPGLQAHGSCQAALHHCSPSPRSWNSLLPLSLRPHGGFLQLLSLGPQLQAHVCKWSHCLSIFSEHHSKVLHPEETMTAHLSNSCSSSKKWR